MSTETVSSPIFVEFIREQNNLPLQYFNFRKSSDPQLISNNPDESEEQGFYSRAGYAARLYHVLMKQSSFLETQRHSKSNLILCTSTDAELSQPAAYNQRFAHFNKTFSLGSKAGYHKVMRDYQYLNGKIPSFYSETYLLPEELDEMNEAFPTSPLWIQKPAGGARGDGINVIDEMPQKIKGKIVIQRYIGNPLLINGLKFDLRFYVSIGSLDPLQIFVHENGLVRLATEPYQSNLDNISNRFAHLTNFSINKKDENFKATNDLSEDGTGNKWTHAPLWPFLAQAGFDPEKIKHDIDDAFAITIGTARKTFIEQQDHKHAFELFGFDVMLDETGKIYILEVNVTPAMGTSSKLDLFVKEPVLCDLFNLAMIPKTKKENEKHFNLIKVGNGAIAMAAIIIDFETRLSRKGGYRCIFPTAERVNTISGKLPNNSGADKVLADWVKSSDSQKKAFLDKHYQNYLNFISTN